MHVHALHVSCCSYYLQEHSERSKFGACVSLKMPISLFKFADCKFITLLIYIFILYNTSYIFYKPFCCITYKKYEFDVYE